MNALRQIWHDIEPLTPERDARLNTLKQLLSGELKGQKVLVFTSYKDTSIYVFSEIQKELAAEELYSIM